ncbi:MAG: CoA-binding protein [Anaerolineaceae bacterium]|nr:CoA-binding protein [Anaerolineaceae bacterium]
MTNLNESDKAMRIALEQAKVIAVVGHSDKPHRTSYRIAQYLRQVGYTVYPVNPTVMEIDGQPSYESLEAIPEPIDIVNVFRRSEHLSDIVDEAIRVGAKVVWAQLGVVDEQARQKALDAGMDVAMNRCIKIEHASLLR